ncbi:hypothetical protein [Streptomyces subrutilus]|nr:hypothetical protein [Streptomyces subrutilus]
MTVRTQVRRPRGLCLGPLWLWAWRIPGAPKVGYGRIAVTDTPTGPVGGKRVAVDGQGWTVVVGGVAFAVLYRRAVPLRSTPL